MRVLASLLIAGGVVGAAVSEAQSFGVGTFFAVVNGKGAVARSSGVERAQKIGGGKYAVFFNRPVDGCGVAASPLGKAGGQASVDFDQNNPNRVVVSTFSQAGIKIDRAFNLIAFCAS
jgi:hypothetical protein